MKPPKNCSKECQDWFKWTNKFQRETMQMIKIYPHLKFEDDFRIRYLSRLEMLRDPKF